MQYKIIVDKQPSSNPSDEKKEYIIDIEELRVKGDVYDSLNVELNRTYVTRRLSLSEYGVLSVLEEPVIEELTEVNIELFEGDNYIYLSDMQGNKFYAEYLIKNEFNDIYATKNEMNSAITQTAESIELSVNQKLTSYATNEDLEEQVTELNSTITQTAESINLEVSKKVGEDEVCSVISQSPDEILLRGNRVVIESDFFDLSKNGEVLITDDTKENATAEQKANFTVQNEEGNRKTEIIPNRILISGGSAKSYMWNTTTWAYIGVSSDNEQGRCRMISAGSDLTFMDCSDGTNTTTIRPTEITTPKLTQTSLESIKKNINKFTKNATDIINNADIYEYNLKSDADEDKKLIGFVIGDNYRTPDEVISKEGQAVELYSAIGILWKAVQELSSRVEKLEKEVQHEKDTF